MSNQDDDRPQDVDEADFVEQHTFADGTEDDTDALPEVDTDVEADVADLLEQATPAPVDDDAR